MTSALTDLAVDLHNRPEVKVAVFTVGGAYFCTGGALKDDYLYAPKKDPTLAQIGQLEARNMATAKTFNLLSTLPQYKVAAIHGEEHWAGDSLISLMDFVHAPDTKKTGLSFMESTKALSSWQGILSKIRAPKARGIVLTSDEVDATGGKEIGIVKEVVQGSLTEAACRY